MLWRAVLFSGCLVAASTYLQWATHSAPVIHGEGLALLPAAIGQWRATPAPLDPAVLEELKLDDYVNRQYRRDGAMPVTLYVGYYGGLHTGNNRGPHSPLLCLPGLGWRLVDSRQMSVAVAVDTNQGGNPQNTIVVTRSIARSGIDGLLVLYWYQIHGKVVPTELGSKAYIFADALRARGTDAALVRLVAPIDLLRPESQAAAAREATAFLRAVYPMLHRHLPS